MRSILIEALLVCLVLLRAACGQEAHFGPLAAKAQRSGNWARVKDLCGEWVKAEPENHEPHLLLGKAYHRAGFSDKAVESFVIATELAPPDPRGLCGLGNTYLAARNFEQAEAEFERALKLDPDCLQALVGAARVLLGQGRLEEALAAAQEATRAHPRCAAAHTVVGDACRAMGCMQSNKPEGSRAEQRVAMLEEAESQYRTALGLSADDADAHFGLGVVLEATERTEEAECAWLSFLEAEAATDRAWLVRHRLVVLDRRRVTDQPFASSPSWSPDGRWLAFGAYSRQGQALRTVYVTKAMQSAALRKLCDSTPLVTNMCPAWSPDGATIAFMCRKWGDTEAMKRRDWQRCKHSCWAGSPTGTPSPRPVTPSGNYLCPCWSADGERLLFLDWPKVGSFSLEGDVCHEFSIARPKGVSWCHRLGIAPTGRTAGFHAVHEDGSTGIFLQRLTEDRAPLDTPVEVVSRGRYICCTFAPTGDVALFGGMVAEKEGAIWAAPIDGSRRPVLVTTFSTLGQWPVGVLSPDGRRLAFDRHQAALWVSRLGGLDLASLRMSARRLPEGLELSASSRSERESQWSVSYQLFDKHSVQIRQGMLDSIQAPLNAGEAIRHTVEVTPAQARQLRVVKIIGESEAGQRVVALVGDDEELP